MAAHTNIPKCSGDKGWNIAVSSKSVWSKKFQAKAGQWWHTP